MADPADQFVPQKPIDPDTFIPPSVRALGAQADRLQREAMGLPPEGEAPVVPEVPVATPPAVVPPAEPPALPSGETPAPVLPHEVTPPGNPTPSDDGSDQEPPPADDTKATYWHRRYRSMKGRYDHELPRYKSTLEQANQRIAELGAELRTRQAAPAPTPVPVPSAEPVGNDALLEAGFTQEEIDMWGPEMAQSIFRVSANMANRASASIGQRVEQIQSSTMEQEAAAMFDMLLKQVPTWKAVNTDPRFLTWLALPDPMSGVIRQELLSKAFEENKASRVVAFFKGFLSEEAPSVPAAPAAVPATPSPAVVIPPPVKSNRIPLHELAAPGGSRSSAQPAPTEKPHYTQAAIGTFFSNKARGLWRGREAEADAIEADIFVAQSEGRVIG